jgi:hypothetical protein
MVYVGLDKSTNAMAVGLATCLSGLDTWRDAGHYVATDSLHSHVRRAESPHVFADSVSAAVADNAGIPLGEVSGVVWRLMFTDGDYPDPDSSVVFVTNRGSAFSDTTVDAWNQPGRISLFEYSLQRPNYFPSGLQATECIRTGKVYLLAGFGGFSNGWSGISFRRMYWSLPDWPSNPDFVLGGYPDLSGVPPPHERSGRLGLGLAELIPGRGRARFRIEAPVPGKARLIVYDVAGRVVKRLLDQALPSGVSYVSWDGRGELGKAVESGIYFARLSSGGESRVARVPLIR